jgi:cation/acetate symporter
MAGAGGLVALLLQVESRSGQAAIIAGVGAMMVVYVLLGGMKGTTWVQIVKAVLLLTCVAFVAVFLLGRYGFNLSALMDDATEVSPLGPALLAPGGWYGGGPLDRLDFLSLGLALVLGISSLPHVLVRFYTVPNAVEARRSVAWCSWSMCLFYLSILVVGFGAAALVGQQAILAAPGGVNSAAPLLAYQIGGTLLLGVVAAVAFATILAVVAGLVMAAAGAVAHDVYANVVRSGNASEREELRVARIGAVCVAVVAIGIAILAGKGFNIQFLVSLTFAVAASANFPSLLLALTWPRFNTTGALVGVGTGLVAAIGLIILSPTVWPGPDSEGSPFGLTNPALVSIPLGFAGCWVGTMLGARERTERFTELHARAETGLGAEQATG